MTWRFSADGTVAKEPQQFTRMLDGKFRKIIAFIHYRDEKPLLFLRKDVLGEVNVSSRARFVFARDGGRGALMFGDWAPLIGDELIDALMIAADDFLAGCLKAKYRAQRILDPNPLVNDVLGLRR